MGRAAGQGARCPGLTAGSSTRRYSAITVRGSHRWAALGILVRVGCSQVTDSREGRALPWGSFPGAGPGAAAGGDGPGSHLLGAHPSWSPPQLRLQDSEERFSGFP